ncbi:3-isopropylmalate dehydratase [Segnochrobactraceae bacterium EtOH-i3]
MSGRAWVMGDDVDTDALAPGRYMRLPIGELARHCLEGLAPDFAASVRPGDVVVGGENFGIGSSREQAAEALRHLGVAAVVARSFAGIFRRNAINLGLPTLVCPDAGLIRAGERIEIDLEGGRLVLPDRSTVVAFRPLPTVLLELLADGGLVPHLEKRFAARAKEHAPR